MKRLNVFIFPTDDRSGQATLIHHYQKLGHNVFIPMYGTFGLNWKRIATWPGLLCKSLSDPSLLNIHRHLFVRDNSTMFGEDFFVRLVKHDKMYEEDVSCELVCENTIPHIDVFHTLRGGEAYLDLYFKIASTHMPAAKWVSSTFNQHSSTPGNYKPKNAAKFIPAPYENHHEDVNNVCLVASNFEGSLLHAENYERNGFASFNHNFQQRQPIDYALFSEMNSMLVGKIEVKNFGGNIRTQGADIRFSGANGITGNDATLTPPEAYSLTRSLNAIVHFKADDWGGGVFYYALNCHTPIITTQRYIDASNSKNFLINGKNCIIVNTPREAADAVLSLDKTELTKKLISGMEEVQKTVQGQDYWSRWERFLESIL